MADVTARSDRVNFLVTILASSFGLWAGVVGFATWLVLDRLETVESSVAEGILPRADERVTSLEISLRELERMYDAHIREEH